MWKGTYGNIKRYCIKSRCISGNGIKNLNGDSTLNVAAETREKVTKIAVELGYRSVSQRHKDTRVRNQEKIKNSKNITVGIAQMFEMQQLQDDIYYMMLKNMVEAECFSNGWNTVSLYRNSDGNFVKNSDGNLEGIVAIGRFTTEEIQQF